MGEVCHSGNGAADGFDLAQFHQVFFEEARENLAQYEALLLALDGATASDEDLNAIFRAAHSIKGGAATFGFGDVAELTHELETLLDRARKRELTLSARMIDCLLAAGDALTAQLRCHQCGDKCDAPAAAGLIEEIRLHATSNGAGGGVSGGAARTLDVRVGPLTDPSMADNLPGLIAEIPGMGRMEATDNGTSDADGYRYFRIATSASDNELLDLFTFYVDRDRVAIVPRGSAVIAATSPADGDPGFGFFDGSPAAPPVAAAVPVPMPVKAERDERPAGETSTLRVSVEKVDKLINLVGELVITQAMLAQKSDALDGVADREVLGGLAELARNTRDLQEAVMSIRMVPMSFVFSRFPRMLRDLARRLDKQVELKTSGEATELDKGLVEKIIDPLTHLVRNAADHGIEMPDERIAKGKPARGTIVLSAQHQGGSIVIEVRDDGRGLNRERILAKARERGLATGTAMSDREIWQFIFAPGFSTAETVTDVSGRGVGMDVVKRNIAELGGSVELDSADGYGTRVSVRLPLTLAIMDGMSVRVGGEVYVLPLGSIVETFQLDGQRVSTLPGGGQLVRVRGDYLPIQRLDRALGVPATMEAGVAAIVMVVEEGGQRAALIVDELIGQRQIVVKNLESNYRRVEGLSGATIMGDGRVALILDVRHFIQHSLAATDFQDRQLPV